MEAVVSSPCSLRTPFNADYFLSTASQFLPTVDEEPEDYFSFPPPPLASSTAAEDPPSSPLSYPLALRGKKRCSEDDIFAPRHRFFTRDLNAQWKTWSWLENEIDNCQELQAPGEAETDDLKLTRAHSYAGPDIDPVEKLVCRRTQSLVDSDELMECQVLPCSSVKHDAIKRIAPETLVKLLKGEYASKYDTHLVVDCRFPYEYMGGHIQGAVNFNTRDELEELLRTSSSNRTLLVFHCEFSVHRAPRMALYLRNLDRKLNSTRYPLLNCPEVYILAGGYSEFYARFPELCSGGYVEMGFGEECTHRMRQFSREFLTRSRSFTEGVRHIARSRSRKEKHFEKSESPSSLEMLQRYSVDVEAAGPREKA
ncbi:uncharacterized protein VTP21DRAFT_9506 [Calcarisporiella thermophila]|uniref:uncharacterized protein n=1 Tax=Calcarisporiella thermophila TaxID=911321 RepID=UPI003743DF47